MRRFSAASNASVLSPMRIFPPQRDHGFAFPASLLHSRNDLVTARASRDE
mgnify:CR=1 FL=1